MRTPPTITTERLVLTPPTIADFDDSVALWADPVVARYTGGVPSSREATWGRLLRYAGTWALRGFGFWTVRTRADERFVGEVGLLDGRREITPAYDEPEAGWALAPWCHGMGFATEATLAALAWADATLDASRVVCMIEPANDASMRVAARCGFEPWVEATYKGASVRLLTRRRG